ncbi:MAG: hypothetical protein ABIU05_00865 [Nitrospirales bacterium]
MSKEYAVSSIGYSRKSMMEHMGVFVSLRRYKKTPEYRTQLVTEGRKARLEALGATTDMARRKARLRAFECENELACLEQGDAPSAFSGFIKFAVPPED